MNKFRQLIAATGEKVLQSRAESISQAAEIAQKNLVNSLSADKINKELELKSLLDLAPETTTSLRPGTKDWNPQDWVIKVQTKKWELWGIEQQLKIAQDTLKEYFTE